MDFSNVSTYINSWNVIFSSKNDDFSKIEEKLKETFWFDIPIIIRGIENIIQLTEQIPPEWKNDTGQKTDVLFLAPRYENEKSLKLIKTTPEVDHLRYIEWAIVWNIDRNSYNKSGMHTFIGTTLYKNMTARNINTVRKLAERIK